MAGSKYDEDLYENEVFTKFLVENKILLETAALNNWVICVPRNGVFSEKRYLLDENFMLSHVLVPDNEIPDFHFINLFGEQYELQGDHLTKLGTLKGTKVLFEELFYTHDLVKVRIWCISGSISSTHDDDADLSTVETMEEAMSYLLKESDDYGLTAVKSVCSEFLQRNVRTKRNANPGQDLRSVLRGLCDKCLDIILTRKVVRSKFQGDSMRMQSLRRAVLMMILYLTYDYCFESVTEDNIEKSEAFNVKLRSRIYNSKGEVAVSEELRLLLPIICKQICAITYFKTPIEKIACLKRVVSNTKTSKEDVSLNDLIPLIVHSIERSGHPHWVTSLAYMTELVPLFEDANWGYDQFLLSNLEAAMCYIMNWSPAVERKVIAVNFVYNTKEEFLEQFFDLIENNDEKGVLQLLNVPVSNEDDVLNVILDKKFLFAKVLIDQKDELCHPLCDCTSCQKKIDEKAPSINSVNEKGSSGLHIAAGNGYLKLVSILLTLGADVNAADNNGFTPLHVAGLGGHQNVLLLLLNSKADLSCLTKDSETVLHLATRNGHSGCVKALLFFTDYMSIQFNIDAQDSFGNTALHIASTWGFLDILECLLEYKAKTYVRNKTSQLPVDIAHNSRIKCILSSQPNEEAERPSSGTFQTDQIVKAITNKDIPLFRFYVGIVDENPEPETSTNKSQVVSKILVQQASVANLYSMKYANRTLLHYACASGCLDIVKDLMKNGAQLETVDESRRTALHIACQSGNVDCALFLIKLATSGVLNSCDQLGNTPLHYAVSNGLWEVTHSLLQHCANVNIKNNNGLRPVDVARKNNFLNIIALIDKLT